MDNEARHARAMVLEYQVQVDQPPTGVRSGVLNARPQAGESSGGGHTPHTRVPVSPREFFFETKTS